ncbi:MAG: hypothetical protein HYZ50_05220 [Deltaproteobacteria bacterium]|nr:hypothetical protein [Deltaproteobacteria bacterium]
MRTEDFLLSLERQGLRCTPAGDRLAVEPADKLNDTLRQEIRARKAELLRLLTHPYINSRGELIIPFTADPKYQWWRGGQSLAETLLELNAPPEVWRRYVQDYTETRQ